MSAAGSLAPGEGAEARAVSVQDSVHESEVVRAFRRSAARWRTEEYSGATDGDVAERLREWHRGDRTSAGFYKAVVLLPENGQIPTA